MSADTALIGKSPTPSTESSGCATPISSRAAGNDYRNRASEPQSNFGAGSGSRKVRSSAGVKRAYCLANTMATKAAASTEHPTISICSKPVFDTQCTLKLPAQLKSTNEVQYEIIALSRGTSPWLRNTVSLGHCPSV